MRKKWVVIPLVLLAITLLVSQALAQGPIPKELVLFETKFSATNDVYNELEANRTQLYCQFCNGTLDEKRLLYFILVEYDGENGQRVQRYLGIWTMTLRFESCLAWRVRWGESILTSIAPRGYTKIQLWWTLDELDTQQNYELREFVQYNSLPVTLTLKPNDVQYLLAANPAPITLTLKVDALLFVNKGKLDESYFWSKEFVLKPHQPATQEFLPWGFVVYPLLEPRNPRVVNPTGKLNLFYSMADFLGTIGEGSLQGYRALIFLPLINSSTSN